MSFFTWLSSLFSQGKKSVSEAAPIAQQPTAAAWPPTDPQTVLAATAWMEDQQDGKEGMQAVMNVVLNRARSGITWWGSDIVSVCLAREQFSSWNAGSLLPAKARAAMDGGDDIFVTAMNLAELAVQGVLPDVTSNSDSYFATSIEPPSWALADHFVVQIGAQRYYRLYLAAPAAVG